MCLGVIPKNENKMDEMTEELQHYIPVDYAGRPVSIGLGGDQLTVERARTCQHLRKHSINSVDQLGGYVPFAADFHAEMILLQASLKIEYLYLQCSDRCCMTGYIKVGIVLMEVQ